MKNTPVRATQRQREYARSLGVDFSSDITKEDIGKLITRKIEERDNERLKRLEELDDRESTTYLELRKEILAESDIADRRLSMATVSQIVEELARRDKGAILISFEIAGVNFSNLEGARFDVAYSENLSDAQMRAAIISLGGLIALQATTSS